ncbi:alpha/beta hydrolase family protein [mine drainage metagenome]|uniref:Alpha/beta hydrolase family protein n=1 Tax=mine drainage metagenome TaxID=410659 RepID=A0A1J5QM16_9ZZZZ
MTRFLAVLLLSLSVAACTPRGTITLDPQAASVGAVRAVFVGTTRKPDPKTGTFGTGRLEGIDYARLDISVPPDRTLGSITWPRRGKTPDPSHDFLTTQEQIFANAANFRTELSHALRVSSHGTREAVVYVHGFNNTFAEGVYRIAQLSHDLDMPGVAVHYSWPSAENPLNYAYDRDSALFARDGLEKLLTQVAAAGADHILIVGHSMGSELVMEALRQMRLDGNTTVMSRLAGVVLISPDIDVEVFRSEALRIGKLPQPFVIFTSQRDRALALSARLTGQKVRLGNLKNVSAVADLQVTVLEVGAFSQGIGHFTAATAPALIKLLSRISDLNNAFAGDRTGRTGLLPGVVLTFQNATQVILSPVAAVAQAAVQ